MKSQVISIVVVLLMLTVSFSFSGCRSSISSDKIDRYELVNRHNILIEGFDSLSSLSIGNGDFAFTTDITGLQTFYEEYSNGVPLGTQSNWGWHVNPNPENYEISESVKMYRVNGRDVPYLHQYAGDSRQARASEYFRANPHRIHLGFIRLIMLKEDGAYAKINDLKTLKHKLDLWQGKITSEFVFENEPVRVEVFCHQDMDLVSARITSPLVSEGRLYIQWEFSYGVPLNTHPGYDFSVPGRHHSFISESDQDHAVIERVLDTTNYKTVINWAGSASFEETDKHVFQLRPAAENNSFEFSCLFTPKNYDSDLPDFQQTQENNISTWKNFWESGGAIDFSGCTDPRAGELERITVLSQYLSRIQSSGSLPPSETGLTYNSWYGKFHLEMHWWHSAHFALWNRNEYLVKQLEYYEKILPIAEKTAHDQGYKGARWPKMVGPDGRESPSAVGTYLIWQQPHIIYFAELIYRQEPSQATLEKYKNLVFATADFMADFVQFDSLTGSYNLVPPLIPAQEIFSLNNTFMEPFTGYKEYLKHYIKEARNHGTHPVLVTSMHRRTFDKEGYIQNSHGDYPEAMRQTAKEEGVPLIDLHAMSKILYEALGPENSKKAFVHYPAGTFPGQDQELKDDTHHSNYGAYELAKCVLEGIKSNIPELAKYLSDDIKTFNPAYPDPFDKWVVW